MKKLCIYCEDNFADTRDHIPPKSVIIKPYPQLIAVPACQNYTTG